jgi:Leucine-rich repeat (LRR) protein
MSEIPSLSAPQLAKWQKWWNELSDTWKIAFNEAVFNKGTVPDLPSDQEMAHLVTSPALRFAGPSAPYPNMSSELIDLSGLVSLNKIEILVVTFHKVRSLKELRSLTQLKSLFLHDNQIASLQGVENMKMLEKLYVQNNQVNSLKWVKPLQKLNELYCFNNRLLSLEGITSAHAKALKRFVCLPNDDLPEKEIIRVEQKVGIRCQRGSY